MDDSLDRAYCLPDATVRGGEDEHAALDEGTAKSAFEEGWLGGLDGIGDPGV